MASDVDRLRELQSLITVGEDKSVPVEERLKKILKRLRFYRDKLQVKIEDAIAGRQSEAVKRKVDHLTAANTARRQTVNVLRQTCWDTFKKHYSQSQSGAAYAPGENERRGDFAQLNKCIQTQLREGAVFTEEGWETACANYFASPMASYTLRYLAVHYGEYRTSRRDRFNKPEVVNGRPTTTREQNVVNINDGARRYGLIPPQTTDNSGNSDEESRGLLPAGTDSGSTSRRN